MANFSQSCVCQSTNKKFRIAAFNDTKAVALVCRNDFDFATNLETQDYEALGSCQPPVTNQYYAIGLRLPNVNTTNRKECNSSHPYFWRSQRNNKIVCVDGSPLELPRNFSGDQRCNLASVLPGSLQQIYNATWTRCPSVQYSICQLENNTSISGFCKNASTPTTTTTTSTPTTPTTSTTPTTTGTIATATALSSNSTAIIIGSALGVLAVLFLLWLLHFFRKRNNARRSASDNEIHEEVYYK